MNTDEHRSRDRGKAARVFSGWNLSVFICVHLWLFPSWLFPPGSVRAQGPGWGETSRLDAFASGMGLGGPSWSSGVGPGTYLPAGTFGGFIPYAPGPGRGLGVMSPSRMEGPRSIGGRMGMSGADSGLGRPRSALRPLIPIGILDAG